MALLLEEVLTTDAVKKLKTYSLLCHDMDDLSCWNIGPIFFPMIFPHIRFHGKIPWAYNLPSFFSYLGFSHPATVRLYQSVAETTNPTRVNLLARAIAHIRSKWSSTNHSGAAVGTMLAELVMDEMDLIDSVKEEVNALYELFQRNAGIFQRYFDENHSKNYENLKLVDFVIELLHQRMTKLISLNQAAVSLLH